MNSKTFWKKVKKTAGCWLWRGQIGTKGYGQMSGNGTTLMAHRIHQGLDGVRR